MHNATSAFQPFTPSTEADVAACQSAPANGDAWLDQALEDSFPASDPIAGNNCN